MFSHGAAAVPMPVTRWGRLIAGGACLCVIASLLPLAARERQTRVMVLSKQIRLMREGRIDRLTLTPRGNEVTISVNGRILPDSYRTILLRFAEGEIIGSIGADELRGSFRLVIEGRTPDAVCEVAWDHERRIYPLPFTAINGPEGLRCVVSEDEEQYAWDAACAEYGPIRPQASEAVSALALVIRGRQQALRGKGRHGEADFCDLTHCQVYRGRIGGRRVPQPWVIDADRLRHGLFFHARCGGRTLGCEVFGSAATGDSQTCVGVRDRLVRETVDLCAGEGNAWERRIRKDELFRILFPDRRVTGTSGVISYDTASRRVRVEADDLRRDYPAETFRLIVNRVKGWNFLRSNNYAMKDLGDGTILFSGRGLGHGVGLCQMGALELDRRGYSRYEILEHYFPDIPLMAAEPATSPYLSYCLVDLLNGTILESNCGANFLKRRMPAGSVFKIVAALYFAAERPDLFRGRSYHCAGRVNGDPNMPPQCWDPHGHGRIDLAEALAKSCNLYFASLYREVSTPRFKRFFETFRRVTGIQSDLPEARTDAEWARLLSGLDEKASFTVEEYILLLRFLYEGSRREPPTSAERLGISRESIRDIMRALGRTMTEGTLASPSSFIPHPWISEPLAELEKQYAGASCPDCWGKTATMAAGTNKLVSYGMFIGGRARFGIVAILRKGNGHFAGRWARAVLTRHAQRGH